MPNGRYVPCLCYIANHHIICNSNHFYPFHICVYVSTLYTVHIKIMRCKYPNNNNDILSVAPNCRDFIVLNPIWIRIDLNFIIRWTQTPTRISECKIDDIIFRGRSSYDIHYPGRVVNVLGHKPLVTNWSKLLLFICSMGFCSIIWN